MTNNLVVPFFEDVIRQRPPADADPSAGPVAMRPAPQAEVWLGDVGGWAEKKRTAAVAPAGTYTGDAAAACWLPSARVAATWRAFVAYDDAVTMTEPPGLGDKQLFTLHTSGKPVHVVVGVKPGEFARVELRDGDKVVATKGAAPFEFEVKLEPGSHPLIVAAHQGNTGPKFSRPRTVIVKR